MQKLRTLAPWLLLGAAVIAYLALRGIIGRPMHVDEIFYKAAGLHWARGEGFRAPEEAGFLGLQPGLETVWAPYPPVFPFLFGVVVKLFGFGWRQSVLYDAGIHAVLALITAFVVRRQAPELPGWVAPLAGCALLPLGTFGRPDELATCFAACGYLALPVSRPVIWRLAAGGALFGLCAGASLGAAVVVTPIVLATVLAMEWAARQKAVAAIVIGANGLLVFAAVVTPLIVLHPNAPHQYLVHLREQFADGTWADRATGALMLGRSQFVMMLAWSLVGPATLISYVRAHQGQAWLRLWAGPLCAVTFLLIWQPGRYFYHWFLVPWLLAAVLGTVNRLPESPLRLLIVTGAGGIYLATVVAALQDEVMLATLPAGQTIEDGATTVRRLVPPGTRVWCNTAWYALAEDHTVLDFWLDRRNLPQVDYIVIAGTGWGDPEAGYLITPARRQLIEQNFDLIWDGLLQREGLLPTHHGILFPDEGYGFGVRVYRAKRLAPAGGP